MVVILGKDRKHVPLLQSKKSYPVARMENQEPSSFDRRKFLANAAKVAGVATVGYVYFRGCTNDKEAVLPPSAIGHTFLTKPYLHSIHYQQMFIRWITYRNCYSWVEYGRDQLDQKEHAVADGLVIANNRVHEIQLNGLQADTTYNYRIASKEIKRYEIDVPIFGETIYSEVYSFKTFPERAEEVRWLVFNDIHDMPGSFGHLLKLNGTDPYDFVFLNGDMFNLQVDEEQIIEHLVQPCTSLFATQRPLLFSRGNHETRGPFALQLKKYFSYPQDYFFYFMAGPVFVIALDTGEDKADDHAAYHGFVDFNAYREQQALWMEKLMQSDAYKQARFRVIMMHIPTHYTKGAAGELHCRSVFTPLFDQYKVDLVISGHTHRYGVHPPVQARHSYPIVIGGGPDAGTRTLMKVKATQQELAVQLLDDTGKVVGKYVVQAK
jgi:UDP-2,3-diacylglucosamine pyrophosphatase LpxH